MAISLVKGQKISLAKEDGSQLKRLKVGVNWGAIEKKGFLGKKSIAVDLDASVGLINQNHEICDLVYFGSLKSKCGAVKHSGDDQVGDTGGDDGQDNEVILIDLDKLPSAITQVALVLNSYKKQDFAEIPFASVRISDDQSDQEVAKFDIANDASFAGKVSMIMGSVYRHNGAWKFRSIGDAITETDLGNTLNRFVSDYL